MVCETWRRTLEMQKAFLPPYHFQWGKWDIVVSIIIIIVIAVWLDILEEWRNLISFLLRLAPAAGGERETFDSDVHKRQKKNATGITWLDNTKKKKTGPQKPSGPDSAAPPKSKIGKSDFLFWFFCCCLKNKKNLSRFSFCLLFFEKIRIFLNNQKEMVASHKRMKIKWKRTQLDKREQGKLDSGMKETLKEKNKIKSRKSSLSSQQKKNFKTPQFEKKKWKK